MNDASTALTVTSDFTTTGTIAISAEAGYTQQDVDLDAGGSNITITADSVTLNSNTGNNAFTTTGTVTLKPSTLTAGMTLGDATTTNSFHLDTTELGDIVAGKLVIGSTGTTTTSGQIVIGGSVSLGSTDLDLLSTGGVVDGADGSIVTTGTVTVDAAASSVVLTNSTAGHGIAQLGAVVAGSGFALDNGDTSLTVGGAITTTDQAWSVVVIAPPTVNDVSPLSSAKPEPATTAPSCAMP